MVDEIEELVADFGVRSIIFGDDNFAGAGPSGLAHADKICREMRRRNLHVQFWAMLRTEVVAREGSWLLPAMKSAGLVGILLGVESGSPGQLGDYGKSVNAESERAAVACLHEHQVMVEVGFIMFYPLASLATLRENAGFLLAVDESSSLRYYASRLAVYPGTRITDILGRAGLIAKGRSPFEEYAYEYRDLIVARIADLYMGLLDDTGDWDAAIWNLKRLVVLIQRLANNCDSVCGTSSSSSRLCDVATRLRDAELDVGRLNHAEFTKCLDLAERGTGLPDVEELAASHRLALKASLSPALAALTQLESLLPEISGIRDSDMVEWFYSSPSYRLIADTCS